MDAIRENANPTSSHREPKKKQKRLGLFSDHDTDKDELDPALIDVAGQQPTMSGLEQLAGFGCARRLSLSNSQR